MRAVAKFGNIVLFAAIFASMLTIPVTGFAQAATTAATSTPPAANTSQSALTVSPTISEDVVSAATPKVITIQVTNITGFPLPISGTVKNFVPLEQIDSTTMQSKYDASKWFVITEPDFILQPKQTRPVTITITPPNGAEPGGHYATIYFTPLIPASVLTPSTAYLTAQVGTLAFLIVPGALQEKISIATFTTPHVHQSRSINFALELKNSGNVHLAPNGYLDIRNWRGTQIGKVQLKPGIVLPGTQKDEIVLWRVGSFIGKYTATAHVTYGSANHPASSVIITFWVIPWELILSISVFVIIVTFVFKKTHGRWKHAWSILRGKPQQ